MDFSLTDEQHVLKDSVARFLEREYDGAVQRRILAAEGFDPAMWVRMADNGLVGAHCGAADGGFGGPIETMIIMELFGRRLVLEPMVQCAVVAGAVLAGAEPGEARERRLQALIEGRLRACVALLEPGMRSPYDIGKIRAAAALRDDAWTLTGEKVLVHDGAAADHFLVTAREPAGEASVFLIAGDAPGLRRRHYRTLDGRTVADLELHGVRVRSDDRIAGGPRAVALLDYALDRGLAAACAEAIGSMDCLLEATIAHLKQREQYGVALASFQALQHRVAEMFVELETGRSMAFLAASSVAQDGPTRASDLSAARVQIGRAARFVGQQSVQLHGGMGMAEAGHVAPHFKRLTVLSQLFGDESTHLRRFRGAGGAGGAGGAHGVVGEPEEVK